MLIEYNVVLTQRLQKQPSKLMGDKLTTTVTGIWETIHAYFGAFI